ncbi:MAG: TusE/DsrC/DsvC family sulfur relay protein [Rhodospirillaceae bacterium]|nr:TusE/DsrC/DsvC family sulfur relay protein [Rhodospirillaceae bacterium]MBL6931724.1 TusE/DsrC/DsvC family sulfur relay protein [Rhodospirillales bacterium]
MVKRDPEGYLIEPEDWTDKLAHELAAEEEIVLTDEHWVVIKFMRDHYKDNQVTPDVRHAMKQLKEECGAGRNRIFELFPYGYVQQACKIAGMKRPRTWSTG